MMFRSSTTTIGSRVVSIVTGGAESRGSPDTWNFSLTSATAVPLLGAEEEHESYEEHHDRPGHAVPPQMHGRLVQFLVDVVAVAAQQREPRQLDVDVRRVRLEDVPDPRVFVDLGRLHQVGQAVDDAGEVEPGPEDERQQLLDVAVEGADAGEREADPDVEGQLHDQHRYEQEPVERQRLTEAQHDDEQHAHRDEELLQLDDGVRQRQARPREVQGADQRQVVADRLGAGVDRPLGEREDEDTADQERDERVVRQAAARVEQQSEDQVVDRGVEQRRQYLPDLAQPRLGVHRDVLGRRERPDEVATLPELTDVGAQRGAGGALLEPVSGGELGQRRMPVH